MHKKCMSYSWMNTKSNRKSSACRATLESNYVFVACQSLSHNVALNRRIRLSGRLR